MHELYDIIISKFMAGKKQLARVMFEQLTYMKQDGCIRYTKECTEFSGQDVVLEIMKRTMHYCAICKSDVPTAYAIIATNNLLSDMDELQPLEVYTSSKLEWRLLLDDVYDYCYEETPEPTEEPHHKDCPAVDGFGCHCDGTNLEYEYIIDQVEHGFETKEWAIENGLPNDMAENIKEVGND